MNKTTLYKLFKIIILITALITSCVGVYDELNEIPTNEIVRLINSISFTVFFALIWIENEKMKTKLKKYENMD